MRLFLSTLALALMLGGTALAAPPGPDPPVAPSQTPAAETDLRAPDQIAPAPPVVATTDLRTPDQRAPARGTPAAPSSDGGPTAIVFVLIGVGAALVLLTGVYFGARWRHRLADADDLVVTH
jgi:hypothetical protein